jgi:hypothetical protein
VTVSPSVQVTEQISSEPDEPSAPAAETNAETARPERFNDEELLLFELIRKYYPDFLYSNTYTYTSEKDKKMIFDRDTNEGMEEYNSYDVIYTPYGMVNYFFDMGTAYRGYGTYYIIDNSIINIEKSTGEFKYVCRITKNGVTIDEIWGEYRNEDGSLKQ